MLAILRSDVLIVYRCYKILIYADVLACLEDFRSVNPKLSLCNVVCVKQSYFAYCNA